MNSCGTPSCSKCSLADNEYVIILCKLDTHETVILFEHARRMKARELIALGHIHSITNPNRSSIPRNHVAEETCVGQEIKLPQLLPLSETAGSYSHTEAKNESHSFQRSTFKRGPGDRRDDEDEWDTLWLRSQRRGPPQQRLRPHHHRPSPLSSYPYDLEDGMDQFLIAGISSNLHRSRSTGHEVAPNIYIYGPSHHRSRPQGNSPSPNVYIYNSPCSDGLDSASEDERSRGVTVHTGLQQRIILEEDEDVGPFEACFTK